MSKVSNLFGTMVFNDKVMQEQLPKQAYQRLRETIRNEIRLEKSAKVLNIEALTMADMARKDILPAMSAFPSTLARGAANKTALAPALDCSTRKHSRQNSAP